MINRKPKIIAVVNQKGGVGKTTTAVNLATALSAIGKRVVIIDLDAQGNATTGLGLSKPKTQNSSYGLLAGLSSFSSVVKNTSIPNLFLVPSTMDLSAADVELSSHDKREVLLKKALSDTDFECDYVFIDCPPGLGLVTLNALTASQWVLIPLQCEFYALEGLAHLMRTINRVRKNLNTSLSPFGIVLTMYDRRSGLSQVVASDVEKHFSDLVFSTVIPRNIKVTEAPSHGKPVLLYDVKCTGSLAYIALAKEFLNREKLFFKNAEREIENVCA